MTSLTFAGFNSDGVLFELFEHALIAFMLSGMFWNIVAGHELIPASEVPKGMLLTTVLLISAFSSETINNQASFH